MRSKRLQVVLELAEREKDAAAQAFEQAQMQFTQEQHKLTQLSDYYRDYESSFSARRDLRASDLMQQRNFLQQLSQAQQQQQAVINSVERLLEEKRELWHKCHLKHQKLAELIARYRSEEEAALAKKEQKVMDEWAQRVFR